MNAQLLWRPKTLGKYDQFQSKPRNVELQNIFIATPLLHGYSISRELAHESLTIDMQTSAIMLKNIYNKFLKIYFFKIKHHKC